MGNRSTKTHYQIFQIKVIILTNIIIEYIYINNVIRNHINFFDLSNYLVAQYTIKAIIKRTTKETILYKIIVCVI